MVDEFTCPLGGQWYACASAGSKFVGCCMSDPCSNIGCTQGGIRPVGFNASKWGTFPDASCGNTSDFWTCQSGKTFWGCCKTDPCFNEPQCPDGDLEPALMNRPEQFSFYAASQIVSSTASISSATASPTFSSDGGSKSNGAVIGGAVGGALGGILIIGLIVFFLFRRRRSQQTERGETIEVASPMMGVNRLTTFDNSPWLIQVTEPPTYSGRNGDYYQGMAPAGKMSPYTQSPYPQGQWAHMADGPQEMDADVGLSNRYSELPAEVSRPGTHHRYSELSSDKSCRASPHHSPKPSQTENDLETRPQGLGVVTEGERS
ncbi:hypothetical protein EJ07DRAFT_161169 [Lizonia empirigonia]|nr:hypothetical protein EJ07DRAFT_161169 [Lizonia empirigonia]